MSLIYSYVSSFHCPGGLQVEEECSSLNNSLQGMAYNNTRYTDLPIKIQELIIARTPMDSRIIAFV